MNVNDMSRHGTDLLAAADYSSQPGRTNVDQSGSKLASSPTTTADTGKRRMLPWSKKNKRKTKEKGAKRKKQKKPPQFVVSEEDPFVTSTTGMTFFVRGKPIPQERDRMGWNGNRYNPSKPSQKAFARAVMDACYNDGLDSMVVANPRFGDALVVVTASFHFPVRKNGGSIKNTADVDNLAKFLLDSLNGVLYNDDGQVVKLVAEKSFSNTHGGNGYTSVSIETRAS